MIFMWIFLVLLLISSPFLIWWGATHDKEKAFRSYYDKLYRPLMAAREKHTQNMEYLNRIGFHADRSNNVGHKHFLFDYKKALTCCEEFYIDDKFLSITRKNYQQLLPFINRGESYCRAINVFRYDKIIDCVLIQDGSVVKSSEGSAILAGTSVPMLGVLQGKASSSSDEHQTGILSVRLTLDDMQNPSILFTFNRGNMDKSSADYANNFQQAQEVFGIFDAIVRMNLKAMAVAPPKSVPSAASVEHTAQFAAASAPVQSGNESAFEKIRQLGKLRDEGLLTEEEFTQKKKLLMEQIQ